MASRGASLFAFFFCNEKKKGGFGVQPQELPHKPLGTDQTTKCGKMWPIKRKQGEKCYFSPCALISKSYQMPPAVCRSSLALPFVLVQELMLVA